jgi:hypothetical protein
VDGDEEIEPQGHTGAVYNGSRPRTVGQDEFHNLLRAQMSPSKTIQQMAAGMRAVASSWIWGGEAPPAAQLPVADVEFRGPSGSSYDTRKGAQANIKSEVLDEIVEAAE